MHAGGAKNSSGQRAHGDKFHAGTAETNTPAGSLPIYVEAGQSFSRRPLSGGQKNRPLPAALRKTGFVLLRCLVQFIGWFLKGCPLFGIADNFDDPYSLISADGEGFPLSI